MARKKTLERHDLMAATEKLLLEKGYSAFHFRLLAEELNVGRSTIYDYYSNKDELIIAFIHSFAYERVEECKTLDSINDATEQLKAYLRIFLKYNHIEQVVTMVTQMENDKKPQNAEGIIRIKELVREIYSLSLKIISNAKRNGLIRKEVDDTFISYVMFHLVKIPNFRGLSEEERLDELLSFLLHGVSSH
ncbi:MAG: TetR/AcrR family transcriptional regulator [Bacillus sp. (in: firmicutes)]